MEYEITAGAEFLRATLLGRETAAETRAFMRAVARANEEHACTAILLDVRRSRSIFHSEPSGFLDCFRKLLHGTAHRVALLGDTEELRLSHEYLALLARQAGLNVWSFAFEAAATRWLTNRRRTQDRRFQAERRDQSGKRSPLAAQRRRQARRAASERHGSSLAAT